MPMAWCDAVEPRTLRECRIALGQSQAAVAAVLGVPPESYRTWDAGRRATPPKLLARARALATHRDDHALARLVGAAGKAVVYQWEARKRTPSPLFWQRIIALRVPAVSPSATGDRPQEHLR